MSIEDGKPFNIIPEPPYEKYSRGYVRIDQKQQRRIVWLHGNSQKLTATAYARYLYNVHLYKTENRVLLDTEVVDHINNDRLDDRIENFQILTVAENNRKESGLYGKKCVLMFCPVCAKFFIRRTGSSPLVNCHKNRVSCCSIECRDIFSTYNLTPERRKDLSNYQVVALFRILDYSYVYLEDIFNTKLFYKLNWEAIRKECIDDSIPEEKLFNKFIHDSSILERKLQRKLFRYELIHYKDGNVNNINPDNLFVIHRDDKDKLLYGYNPKLIYNDDNIVSVTVEIPERMHVKKEVTAICPMCNKEFIKKEKSQEYCSCDCANKCKLKLNISKEELIKDINTIPYISEIGRKYNISSTSIRRLCDKYNIDFRNRYKKKV